MALDNFGALLFVPPTPKVLAEIKYNHFQHGFLPIILRLDYRALTQCQSFTMTWLSWLTHYIIFQIKKETG